MLCDNCKKNEATVHIKKLMNGAKQEYSLCDSCANELNGMSFVDISSIGLSNTFTVQDLLGGIIDYVNQSSQSTTVNIQTCKNCGMSYTEFKKTGLMGCSQCYESFKDSLVPIIKRVQGNIEHVGKIPKKSGKEIMGKRQLLKLKEDLNKAITSEEYEKAAEIRDEIRGIQGINKEM
ncbi:MAG: UvrB/UvrC motif-containing protein [Clostridiaceae bacterium]|nr:UvrB/UvrC motif-containing protein [Clostridiaceae bacterium]